MSLEIKIVIIAIVSILGMISLVSWVRKKMKQEDEKKLK